MCRTCGCVELGHEHVNVAAGPDRGHPSGAERNSEPTRPRSILLKQSLLAKNDRLAIENRAWFDERGILAVNLMGAPGSGKTTLLEQTITTLGAGVIGVIEGDQATDIDAARIRALCCPVVQINTGGGCHLDAG